MTRPLVLLFCLLVFQARAQAPKIEVQRSLVRITATSQEPDYKAPWNPGNVAAGVGAGFVIDGQRILTNAHVVSNARFIVVLKENDPSEYPARVEFIGHDCDLAVLKVTDPRFFRGTAPLRFGPLPVVQSNVSVFGYPIGGEKLSVTRGIVSRIDFQSYTHSGVDSHLAVQIDAAINPGNSGGPVLQDGKVVGIAFQGFTGDVAQNTGYMIPTPVINRFLEDISRGRYDRYVDLSISYNKLLNLAARNALGLDDDNAGVLVSSVSTGGSCDGKILPEDVLLTIDGHLITSDGSVQLDGDVVALEEVVERKFKGDKVDLGVLRDKKALTISVTLQPNDYYLIQANSFDEPPHYLMVAGLVFQPLSRNLIEANQVDDLRLRFFYNNFVTEEIYREHPEVVVLSNILLDPANAQLTDFRNQIVDEINHQKIRTLRDAADAFGRNADFYVIKFIGGSRPAVLEKDMVREATQRVKKNFNVPNDRYLGEESSR